MKTKIFVLAIALSLLLSGMLVAVGGEATEGGLDHLETDIVLVSLEGEDDVTSIESAGGEILERYPDRALVEIPEKEEEELLSKGIDIANTLPARTEISVKGHRFDINEGTPDFSDDLTIDSYESEEKGLHLVHMIGPVHADWREELEKIGVEILNYVPNYAYEIKMTPETAEKVEDLYFVDWVDIYQPGFKLEEGLEPGQVTVQMTDGSREIKEIEDEARFAEIAQRSEVYYISNYKEPELHDEISSQTIGGGHWIMDPDDDPYVPWRGHNNEYEYGAHANHLGYSGDGLISVVADTGIHETHEDFQDRVIGGYYWGDGDDYTDGDGHGTHVAGSVAGDTYNGTGKTVDDFLGVEVGPYYAAQGLAYESELYSARIFDDDGDSVTPEDYTEIVTEPRDEIGPDAYIHANSWAASTRGSYGIRDSDYDSVVRDAGDGEPMIITVSAGNDGEDDGTGDPVYQSTGSPGNAKNVITVGASETFYPGLAGEIDNYEADPDRTATFSSRGWTEDGRVKPDVMAPGMLVASTYYDEDAPGNDEYYEFLGGTSMSNPAVAGAAGVIVEWYEDEYGVRPSPAMVKALMINTAYDMEDQEGDFYTGPIPNRDEGWGMVNLPRVIDAPVNFMLEDQTSVLETGQAEEYEIQHQYSNEPLKISLVWTDAPAAEGADPALVNNLNLEVETPNGEIIRGNAFDETGDGVSDDGFTYPGAEVLDAFDNSSDGWDDRNNVQNVYIHQDEIESGNYTVRVRAKNIGESVVDGGQDYALTMYNAVPEGEEPSIDLTRPKGGELWEAGTEEDIEWSTEEGDDPVDYINLYYSVDGKDSWKTIATEVADTGNYTWLIPENDSEESHVRAVAFDEVARRAENTSDAFAIGLEVVEKYNLTIKIDGEGSTNPTEGTHTYGEGTVVTVKAMPAEGWYFEGWTGDYKGDEEQINITMDSNKEITAWFEESDQPDFEVEITDYDEEIEVGRYIMVEYTVENTGEVKGTQNIIFSVEGSEEERENVTLEPGENRNSKFFWQAEIGSHLLTVESEDDADTVAVYVSMEEQEIPGFTSSLLLLAVFTAGAIYYKKDQ